MKIDARWIGFCLLSIAAGASPAHAQGRGGGQWSTPGGDAQRTGWIRSDPKVSKETVGKDFQFLWKSTLEQPKGLNSLTQPLQLPNIMSY
jgi:hypothetical protein